MSLRLGDTVPNFDAETTQGPMNFHEWIGDSWAIMFSHPADYTPVCTTELARVANMQADFESRNCKVATYSCDSVEAHLGWSNDIKCYGGKDVWYPIIGGEDRKVGQMYGMLNENDLKSDAGMPLTCRTVFFISPEKKLKCSFTYPASTGRNFDEVIRVLDSLQMVGKHKLATPEGWKPGQRGVIVPSVKEAEAKALYPNYEAKFPYLRLTDYTE